MSARRWEPGPGGAAGPWIAARAVLGVGPDDDRDAIRAAYRRAVRAHPPDREPAAFRRVRDAYELLSSPLEHAGSVLACPTPLIAPPATAGEEGEADPGPSPALAILRHVAGQLDAASLLPEDEQ